MPTTAQNPARFDSVSIALLHIYRTARSDFYKLAMADSTREYCVALEQQIFALAESDYYAVARIVAALARIAERTGEQDYYAALLLADSPLFAPKIKQEGNPFPPDEDRLLSDARAYMRGMYDYPTNF